jgi:GTP-binding protein
MADGVLLLVDAFEGPMPQTRFVLQKALQLNLKPVVVINKVDRPAVAARTRCSTRSSSSSSSWGQRRAARLPRRLRLRAATAGPSASWRTSGRPDAAAGHDRRHVPPPQHQDGPLQMLVAAMDHSDYVGRIGIGRVVRGTLRAKAAGGAAQARRQPARDREAALRLRQPRATGGRAVGCGDICAVVGLDDVDIGDTLADPEHPEPLPIIAVDEPDPDR